MPILFQEYPFAEVFAYVYVPTSVFLFNVLPLEAALASVHVCMPLFQTRCAELRSLHDERRAYLGACYYSKLCVRNYAHCTTSGELTSVHAAISNSVCGATLTA